MKPRSIPLSGTVLVFLAAVCWSLNSPVVQYLTLGAFTICALRSAIAGLALLPFFHPRDLRINCWSLIYCLFLTALCVSVILALTKTTAAIAIGMQFTAPVWLFLLQCITTRKCPLRSLLPIGLILIGIAFFIASGGSGDSTTEGNIIAFLEGIFFAGLSYAAKKSNASSPLSLTAMGQLFVAIAVFLLIPEAHAGLSDMTTLEWAIMIFLGVVQVGGGYGFYTLGIAKISPQKASLLALWEMILSPIWVAIFLGRYPTPLVMAGLVIIVLGLIVDQKLPIKKAAPSAL